MDEQTFRNLFTELNAELVKSIQDIRADLNSFKDETNLKFQAGLQDMSLDDEKTATKGSKASPILSNKQKESISGEDFPYAEDEPFEYEVPVETRRKMSMFHRHVAAAEESSQQLTMQARQPSYSHIALKKLRIPDIFSFFEALNDYEVSYSIKLKAATLLDPEIVRTLSDAKCTTTAQMLQTSNAMLMSIITEYIRPNNVIDFSKALNKHVEFELLRNYKPTPTDFKPFYNALLAYRNRFLKIFTLLASENDINVPPCNNKDGGLIKTFTAKIPFEYGTRLNLMITTERGTTIFSYLKQFYALARKDSERARENESFRNHFGGTEYMTRIRDSQAPHAAPRAAPAPALHSLTPQMDSEPHIQLAALAPSKPAPREQYPCFSAVLGERCTRENCKFSHDTAIIHHTRNSWLEALLKLKNTPQQRSILPRPANLAMLYPQQSDDSDSQQEDDYDYQEDYFSMLVSTASQQLFYAENPGASIFKAVHRQGTVTIGTTQICVYKALFDTGALSANYVSQRFVDQHPVLQENLLKIRTSVKLGAKDIVVPITHSLKLVTTFTDAAQELHQATIVFNVLPTTNYDIIIGLPAIIFCFGRLFQEMLQSAMDNAKLSDTLHSLSPVGDGPIVPAPDLRLPWTTVPEEEAPEDAMCELPCSFPNVLHFMEMSVDDAVSEFHSQIDDHVSQEFRDSTSVVELLKSKGVNAFVPQNWDGINGLDLLELSWHDNLPAMQKPRARPVNPRLFAAADLEFQRLSKYFYQPSSSPIASCLVIAPKATKPFIRFCGDYVDLNKYIDTGHFPIPHVQRSLEKIVSFELFLDIDLANAFHQVRLAPLTSQRLSVQTPWGQFEPKFMPEGIGPASGILQRVVSGIFSDFSEWCIAIFDNILVLAHDYVDAYTKLEQIIDRCIERNVYLKFSKTFLGFREVKFFGYLCRHRSHEITQDRKLAIQDMSQPGNTKQMQSFLGAALFFKPFVPKYSELTAPLTNMVKQHFDWSDHPWTAERTAAFAAFKGALMKSMELFYPDYSLKWILRTDASIEGCGGQLVQVAPDREETIAYISHKFSDQARRWSTIEQEAFSPFFCVKKLDYYLRCKFFELETDHNNLRWMEASTVPKIIRWRVYLQSFNFVIRHIPGKTNVVADWLSRQFPLPDTAALSNVEEVTEPRVLTAAEILPMVHGGNMLHLGARRSWLTANKLFPGHRIPFREFAEFVADCPVCQKDRLGMTGSLAPIVRNLKPLYRRKAVGIDTLTVTPPDQHGNCYIYVVVVHATKLVGLYPTKSHTALDAATALFQFFSTFGVFEVLITDPGSDLMSEAVNHLTKWYGIRHNFSLVDRHESNGVEGTNKQILRHLKALVADKRVLDSWSAPQQLCLIQYVLNSEVNSETGMSPFQAHFGTEDATYFLLPDAEKTSVPERTHEFVRLLDQNLRSLWDTSTTYQQSLVKQRQGSTTAASQNQFQPGDLVLFQLNPSAPLPSKLTFKFSGPYEVISQTKNDVQARHLNSGVVGTYHVERLKLFTGTREEALKIAMLDHDQHVIDRILYHRGDPMVRTTMEFFIAFADGTQKWVTWSKDLYESVPYEDYCRAHPPLFPLIHTVAQATDLIRALNKTAITAVAPGDTCFVDLRWFSSAWFQSLQLPSCDTMLYVLEFRYLEWVNSTRKNRIKVKALLTDRVYTETHYFVRAYGSTKVFNPDTMTLVDQAFAIRYPQVLPDEDREALLKKWTK